MKKKTGSNVFGCCHKGFLIIAQKRYFGNMRLPLIFHSRNSRTLRGRKGVSVPAAASTAEVGGYGGGEAEDEVG